MHGDSEKLSKDGLRYFSTYNGLKQHAFPKVVQVCPSKCMNEWLERLIRRQPFHVIHYTQIHD